MILPRANGGRLDRRPTADSRVGGVVKVEVEVAPFECKLPFANELSLSPLKCSGFFAALLFDDDDGDQRAAAQMNDATAAAPTEKSLRLIDFGWQIFHSSARIGIDPCLSSINRRSHISIRPLLVGAKIVYNICAHWQKHAASGRPNNSLRAHKILQRRCSVGRRKSARRASAARVTFFGPS